MQKLFAGKDHRRKDGGKEKKGTRKIEMLEDIKIRRKVDGKT